MTTTADEAQTYTASMTTSSRLGVERIDVESSVLTAARKCALEGFQTANCSVPGLVRWADLDDLTDTQRNEVQRLVSCAVQDTYDLIDLALRRRLAVKVLFQTAADHRGRKTSTPLPSSHKES